MVCINVVCRPLLPSLLCLNLGIHQPKKTRNSSHGQHNHLLQESQKSFDAFQPLEDKDIHVVILNRWKLSGQQEEEDMKGFLQNLQVDEIFMGSELWSHLTWAYEELIESWWDVCVWVDIVCQYLTHKIKEINYNKNTFRQVVPRFVKIISRSEIDFIISFLKKRNYN